MQRQFQKIVAAVDFDFPLPLFHNCADARGCQDTAKPRTGRANTFDQGALGDQFNLELAGNHPFLSFWIGADVGHDHFCDAARRDQPPDPDARTGGVVGDDAGDRQDGAAAAMTVRSQAPRSINASMIRAGVPTPMNPPIMTLAPSGISAAASVGEIDALIVA